MACFNFIYASSVPVFSLTRPEEHAVLRLLTRLEGCGGSLFALEAQSLLLQI